MKFGFKTSKNHVDVIDVDTISDLGTVCSSNKVIFYIKVHELFHLLLGFCCVFLSYMERVTLHFHNMTKGCVKIYLPFCAPLKKVMRVWSIMVRK